MPTKPEVCILPVAGLSTRNLPATKVIHKGFLTLHGKPIIQYAVDACAAAGVKEVIFIYSDESGKDLFERYFKTNPEFFGFSKLTGKREPETLCLTNPELLETAVENLKKRIRAFKEKPDLFTIGFRDSWNMCQCEKCLATITLPGGGIPDPLLPECGVSFLNLQRFSLAGRDYWFFTRLTPLAHPGLHTLFY